MIAVGKIGTQWSSTWRTGKYTVRGKVVGRIAGQMITAAYTLLKEKGSGNNEQIDSG